MQALGAGHIQVSFVNGNHLDLGREVLQDLMDFLGIVAVAIGMAVDENGVRAELSGGAQGHGGVYAKFAGFVGSGRYYASLVALAADDHRFAPQGGIKQLLDRYEKGVHVHVEVSVHDRNISSRRRGEMERISDC
jgi:hypothetical protein